MPSQPAMSDLHVDRVLTNISTKFTQANDNFVARKVFPTVNVEFKSDLYRVFDREWFWRSDVQQRGPAAESAGTGYEFSQDSYNCTVYALHHDIADQERANTDSDLSLDSESTELLSQHMMQHYEQLWFSTFFTTGVWGTDVTPANKWDDYVSGDPIGDIREGIIAFQELIGRKPNTLLMDQHTQNKLQDHPDLLARISGGATTGTPALWSNDQLARMFGIDRVMVSQAVKNTSPEGVAASYSFIAPKGALLMYVAPNPGRNTPSAGYTFNWRGLVGQGRNGSRVKKFRLERNASDRVEIEAAFDLKQVSSECGYFFNATVS